MPNIASVLKEEIARVARKEVRGELQSLKKASVQYRGEIASLKRRLKAQEATMRRFDKMAGKGDRVGDEDAGPAFRFSAKGLASHRQRLGLSAAQLGSLIGVSGQSVYKWESGKAKPRASQLPAIAALRAMTKKAAAERLAG